MNLMSMSDQEVWDELKSLYHLYNEGTKIISKTPEGKEEIYDCLKRAGNIEHNPKTSYYDNWVLTDDGKDLCLLNFKNKVVCTNCGK